MIELVDFSNCELSKRNLQYGGRAGEKRGIIYDDALWILKFPKTTIGMRNINNMSYVTSPLSEYIGSNIYKILGYNVHETKLGICFDGKRNKVVCACKDFINDDSNELLIPYTALRNDTNPLIMERRDSSISSASNIEEIMFQLKHNTILSIMPDAWERFWDVALIDMLINNNDRNEDNWGVIKYKNEDKYKLAPIYDCGNCFYGKADEEKIINLLANDDKLIDSATHGITAYEDMNEKRITALNILNYIYTNNPTTIINVYNKIIDHKDEIIKLIKDIPNCYQDVQIISENRKDYYIKTFDIRLNYLKNNYIDIDKKIKP